MCYMLYLFFVRKNYFLLFIKGGQREGTTPNILLHNPNQPTSSSFSSSSSILHNRNTKTRKTNEKQNRMSSAEEFSSNESGWTKYLGSPSQEEGNYSSGVYDDECNFYHRYDLASHRGGGGGKHNSSDDNDSVASDASSGPSHHEAFIARNMNRGGGSSNFSAVDEEEDFYYGRAQSVGERACKDAKGKAAKEAAVVDHKGKKGISLKQKRGKKAN